MKAHLRCVAFSTLTGLRCRKRGRFQEESLLGGGLLCPTHRRLATHNSVRAKAGRRIVGRHDEPELVSIWSNIHAGVTTARDALRRFLLG